MTWLEPVTLANSSARLEPTTPEHAADLAKAAADGDLWNLWYTMIPKPDGVPAEIERRLGLQAAGSMLPFTVFPAGSAKAVGMTTYMAADPANKRVEIGSTWYARSHQGTGLNANCKYLLLRHAFETLRCNAVELRTHFMNRQSRAAIEGLGAKLDGVLRNHMAMPNGTLRDTCVYSIIAGEWPAVAANLEHRIEKAARQS